MLNVIWGAFVLLAILVAAAQVALGHDPDALGAVVESTFEMAKVGFEIALGLTGVMALWLGILRIGERGGAVRILSRLVRPLFRRLFPGVPEDHPASGAMVMNFSANMLGLDNAATPLGLEAMRSLQSLNPDPERASDAQILFLVLNTSSVTLIPISIFTYRAQAGAADPTDVFVPILIATFCSSLVGLLATALTLRLRIWNGVVLGWVGGLALLVFGLVAWFQGLPSNEVERLSALLAHATLATVIGSFLLLAAWRRVPVFEVFVEGAKDGFKVAVQIIPYLVGMLVALGMLRASGALDLFLDAVRSGVEALGWDTRWVEGLPTALMKPLSGSGARGAMVETMTTHGPDGFAGRLASVLQGSTETTFYIIAVYFGAVGIRRPRQAIALGLLADLAGIVAAIFVAYLFFG